MDGIIVVNKSGGITSHDIVQIIRKILPGVKAGHTGTLDPMATGVLPVCIGRATRLSEYIIELPKSYRAEIILGKISSTEDAAGHIVDLAHVPFLDREEILEILRGFTGDIKQLPPLYSAVKHHGKPLYYWARQGESVPRRIRTVRVHSIDLLEYNLEREPQLLLDIRCSKGTYIRTLAADIGKVIGCGAYLSKLTRTAVGPFLLEESLTPGDIKVLLGLGRYGQVVRKMDSALRHFPELTLDQKQVEALRHGKILIIEQQELLEKIKNPLPIRIYNQSGVFKALALRVDVNNCLGLKTAKYLAE
ncbi:MAG: tRNA pseudouridine(55) synthase TruB [Bacillota bacterium]